MENTPTGDSAKLPDEATRAFAIKRLKKLQEMGPRKNEGAPPSKIPGPPRS